MSFFVDVFPSLVSIVGLILLVYLGRSTTVTVQQKRLMAGFSFVAFLSWAYAAVNGAGFLSPCLAAVWLLCFFFLVSILRR